METIAVFVSDERIVNIVLETLLDEYDIIEFSTVSISGKET